NGQTLYLYSPAGHIGIRNGMTLNGTLPIGYDGAAYFEGAQGSTQTLTGTGTILLQSNEFSGGTILPALENPSGSPVTVVFDSGITTKATQGPGRPSIGSGINDYYANNQKWINKGTILVDPVPGQTVELFLGGSTWINQGTIRVKANGTLHLGNGDA